MQRGVRGYADCDLWDVHTYLSDILPPMLRNLKKGYGCPSEFYDSNDTNNECHLWHDAIEEMAQGFEAAQFLDKLRYRKFEKQENGTSVLTLDIEAQDNAVKKFDRGLELFKKHYLNLWD